MLAYLGIKDQDGAGQVLGDVVFVVDSFSSTCQFQCFRDATALGLVLLMCGHRLTSILFNC